MEKTSFILVRGKDQAWSLDIMDHTEEQLTARLYRWGCPSSIELGEYHLDMLTSEQEKSIKQHLAVCPHCRRELDQLQAYLLELSPDLEHTLAERIKIQIARLLPPRESAPFLQPAMALRGDQERPLVYEAGEAQLTLEIQEDPELPGYKSILGLVMGMELARARATIWQDEKEVAIASIDDLGNFIFTGLMPGQYELILAGGESEIHVQELRI